MTGLDRAVAQAAEWAQQALAPKPVNCWYALTAGDGLLRVVGLDLHLKADGTVVAEHPACNLVLSPKSAQALVENLQRQLAGQQVPAMSLILPGPERPQ